MKKFALIIYIVVLTGCSKSDTPGEATNPVAQRLKVSGVVVDNAAGANVFYNVNYKPAIRISYAAPVDPKSISASLNLRTREGTEVPIDRSLVNNDSTILISPVQPLQALQEYRLEIKSTLRSKSGSIPDSAVTYRLITRIDSTDKFPLLSDEALLTLIQRQTFQYFRDFAHPVSGMIRDRNQNPDLVTTGGTGMGVMAIVTAVNRAFITRDEGLRHVIKIVEFLRTKASTYHGAFAHFVNGSTGATIPFSAKDNGADLVETSLLMQGLLTARQYFTGTDPVEMKLRDDITLMFNKVEWSWFRKDNSNVLYWHWSPQYNWEMNLPIRGWNEALITYVLAAAPGNFTIPKAVYDEGWAANGAIRNGQQFAGVNLPLGPAFGGPMFFSHYSFLGLDPRNLKDQYANYNDQVINHSRIQQIYSELNPRKYNGYSSSIWGLTASDNNYTGYAAHSPVNDLGVIAPTAAVSSLPYTPEESMRAIRFFYYKLGDRLFKDYGFVDAFNLSDLWFAGSFLAIDQAPQIIMIENHRSKLLWNLFMSCPEVKAGLNKLGFTY